MKKVILGMGECFVTKEPSLIEFKGCGNSIVVCMFEDYSKVSGMCHIMVPGKGVAYKEAPMRHSDKAIHYLVNKIEDLGGIKRRIKTKIIGGAVLFERFPETNRIGERIVSKVKIMLEEKKVAIVSTNIGGSSGRNISFETETGRVVVKKTNGEEIIL